MATLVTQEMLDRDNAVQPRLAELYSRLNIVLESDDPRALKLWGRLESEVEHFEKFCLETRRDGGEEFIYG